MSRRWWSVTASLLLMLVLVMSGVAAACSSDDGGKDEDRIKARMETFVDHLNKQDAKGLINDLPSSQRKECNEDQIKQGLAAINAFKFKLKDFKVASVSGNNADADVTITVTSGNDSSDTTDTQKFVKDGGNWYIDTEGKSCADFLQ